MGDRVVQGTGLESPLAPLVSNAFRNCPLCGLPALAFGAQPVAVAADRQHGAVVQEPVEDRGQVIALLRVASANQIWRTVLATVGHKSAAQPKFSRPSVDAGTLTS